MAYLATLILLMAMLSGCAVIMPWIQMSETKAAIRKAGTKASYRINAVVSSFADTGKAAGLDPEKIYVATGSKLPLLNAAAAGDSHFIVSHSLQWISNQCFVWGLVAHEVAHDVLGHASRRAAAASGVGVLATAAGAVIPGAGYIVSAAAHPLLRSYDRGQEFEADQKAIELLEKAGLPTGAMRYTLEFLRDAHGDKGGGWLSSHPYTSERITRLQSHPVPTECPSDATRNTQVEAERQGAIEHQRWLEEEKERLQQQHQEDMERRGREEQKNRN